MNQTYDGFKILAVTILLMIQPRSHAIEVVQGGADVEIHGGPAVAAPGCKARRQALTAEVGHGGPIAEAVGRIAKAGPRLITIGESHSGYALRQIPNLLAEIKKQIPGLNCLFIEFPDRAHKDLQALRDGKINDIDDGRILERSDTYKMAHQLGIDIIPADQLGGRGMVWPGFFDPNGPQPPWQITTEGLNARDENIMGVIQHHLSKEKGKCKSAVLIIGKGHLVNLGNPEHKTITERLKKAGAGVQAINLINPGPVAEGSRIPEWNWPFCTENPAAPEQAVAFASKHLADEITLLPGAGNFNAFDETIVYPDRPFASLMTDEYRAALGAKLKNALPRPASD